MNIVNELNNMGLSIPHIILIIVGLIAFLSVIKSNRELRKINNFKNTYINTRFKSTNKGYRYNPKPKCISFDFTNKKVLHDDDICQGGCGRDKDKDKNKK